jgi:FixJ family two-component response regulator
MQTILVIDDDESLRDTIGVMLKQNGFRAAHRDPQGRRTEAHAGRVQPALLLPS